MIDLVQIRVISGKGGNGAVGYRREKFVANGGPDGGDGGNGGSITIEADEGLTTLSHFRNRRIYKSEPGKPGQGAHKHGGNGESLVLKVPVGTVVSIESDDEGGSQSWDLNAHRAQVLIARGGEGGRGNARFSNSIRQAPSFAEKGLPGEDLNLKLELKLLADVGIVGLPNAGKSTLLRSVSRAMPDVGDFPFTTLEPVLGVVERGLNAFVMADLPGLIEGAHAGVGLGHQFLRHVERTRVLVHLLDASAEDPMADYETIRNELALYDAGLSEKTELVVLNKLDIDEARERAEELRTKFAGRQVLTVSGATGEGTQDLIRTLLQLLQEEKPAITPEAAEAKPLPILRPRERDRLEIEKLANEEHIYLLHGAKAEESALQLGEAGIEALDELQDRLRRMGLERIMRRAGARPGDTIRIGRVDFEWQG